MEDTPINEKEAQRFEYSSLRNSELEKHLRELNFNPEVIEILLKEELGKLHITKKCKPSVLRVRLGFPMGIDIYWSNHIQFCIKQNLKSLCEYIYLKDSEVKMIDVEQ